MPVTRVLIADDDAFLRDLLVFKLSAAGHTVFTAEDGASALSLARALQCDLVVLDGKMPGMDGFEVLSRLRSEPLTSEVPVMMLTSVRAEEDIVWALKCGAVDYLVKPFSPDELVVRIGRILREAKSAAAQSSDFSRAATKGG